MRTRFLNTAAVAILSAALVFATTELSAQSSTRRGTTGGNSTSSTRSTSTSGSQDRNKNVGPSTHNQNNPPRSTTPGSSGRNYNDHMNNINLGKGDRPKGNDNSNFNRPGGNDNKNKPGNNDNKNKPGNKPSGNDNRPGGNNYNSNHPNGDGGTYHGNRGGTNPPKIVNNPPKDNHPKGYNPPRYDRHDPNRYLGYNPFRDGRIIHRPEPYHSAFDFGIGFSTRPSAAVKIRFGGLTLYFSSGVWYNYSSGYYTVYRPPVGTTIAYNTIANNLYYVDFEVPMDYGITYYVDSYANFYMPVRNFRTYGNTITLKVVDAPIGAILYDLPSDYKEIVYNGITYYLVGNSVFEYIYSTANSWYFRCIGIYN